MNTISAGPDPWSTLLLTAAQQEHSRFLEDGLNSCCSIPQRKQRDVTFTTVTVYTHDVILGDNPSCKSGVPWTLDWVHLNSTCHLVEDYEKREGRKKKASRIPKDQRENVLRRKGYTTMNFRQVCQDIEQIRGANRITKHEVIREKMQEASGFFEGNCMLFKDDVDWQRSSPPSSRPTASTGQVQRELSRVDRLMRELQDETPWFRGHYTKTTGIPDDATSYDDSGMNVDRHSMAEGKLCSLIERIAKYQKNETFNRPTPFMFSCREKSWGINEQTVPQHWMNVSI